MAAPFTQTEIQTEIDFYKAAMQKAAMAQSYSAETVSVSKGNLESIQKALQYWLDLMEEYYPDAFTKEGRSEFVEIGFISG